MIWTALFLDCVRPAALGLQTDFDVVKRSELNKDFKLKTWIGSWNTFYALLWSLSWHCLHYSITKTRCMVIILDKNNVVFYWRYLQWQINLIILTHHCKNQGHFMKFCIKIEDISMVVRLPRICWLIGFRFFFLFCRDKTVCLEV